MPPEGYYERENNRILDILFSKDDPLMKEMREKAFNTFVELEKEAKEREKSDQEWFEYAMAN